VAQHECERRLAETSAAEAAAWERLVATFKADWPRIRDKPRVIIHLGSISATKEQRESMPNLDVRQTASCRACATSRRPASMCSTWRPSRSTRT